MSKEKIADEYNLADESWVKVLCNDGAVKTVSLHELFCYAHEYKRLANELPTVDIAILRLLLAIMYGALFNEKTVAEINKDSGVNISARKYWNELYVAKKFYAKTFDDYLTKHKDRFFLFGTKPFMQAKDILPKNEGNVNSVSQIIQDTPTRDVKRFFTEKSGKKAETLDYPTAARLLVTFQAYDYAGKKATIIDGTPNKGGTGWVAKIGTVTNVGSSLFETLMLNFVLVDRDHKFIYGKPYWEQEYSGSPKKIDRNPKNSVELLTWQSRRCILYKDDEQKVVNGFLSCYGDVFEKDNHQSVEIMSGWHESSKINNKTGDKPFIPNKFSSDLQLWRNFPSLIASTSPTTGNTIRELSAQTVDWVASLKNRIEKNKFPVHVVSLEFGSMDAVITELVSDTLTINESLFARNEDKAVSEFQQAVLDVLEVTDEAIDILARLSENIAISEGMSTGNKDKLATFRSKTRTSTYSLLDTYFREWLSNFYKDVSIVEYKKAWYVVLEQIIKDVADSMLDSASNLAIVSRETGMSTKTKKKSKRANDDVMNISIAENIFRGMLYNVLQKAGAKGDA
jgi:CRISPR system Cascade subunit CasA